MSKHYSKHFKKSEFACHCGKCEYSKDPKINRELITALEMIRFYCKSIHLNSCVIITSGRRCKKHNATIKNATPHSKHISGMACDFITPHIPAKSVFDFINSTFPQYFGLSLYSNPDRIHLDVREGKGRW